MRRSLLYALVIVLPFLTLNAQSNSDPASASEVKARLDKWIAAVNSKDLKTLDTFYTADFMGFYAAQPVLDFSANHDEYERLFKNSFLDLKIAVKIIECSAGGDICVLKINEISKIMSQFAKKAEAAGDTGVQIWKKGSDGVWKIYLSALYPLQQKKTDLKK